MKTLLRILMATIALAVATSCIDDNDDAEGGAIATGDTLPTFTAEMHDGTTVTTADLAGHRSVTVFFNTGCPDCRRELPEIEDAYRRCTATGSDVQFICIARDEDAASIVDYWQREGLTLPFSPQNGRALYSLFARTGIPRIYVADASLIVTHTWGDTDSPDADTLLNALGIANDN